MPFLLCLLPKETWSKGLQNCDMETVTILGVNSKLTITKANQQKK